MSTYPISLISLEIKASCHSADTRMPPLASDTPLYRHFFSIRQINLFLPSSFVLCPSVCHVPHLKVITNLRKRAQCNLAKKKPYLWWSVYVCLRESETHKVIWPNHIQTKAYRKSALLDFTGHFHTPTCYHLMVMDELSLWRGNINILYYWLQIGNLDIFFIWSLIWVIK